MNKLVYSDSFNFNEPTVQLVTPARGLTKVASELSDYIKNVKPAEGRTKLAVLALGAGEYWGCNRNGDYFPEGTLTSCYDTFEKFGKVYRHHQNKDPEKSYGDIEKASYNPRMKRVELVIDIPNAKNKDIIDKIASNEDVAVSMAIKVPYDTCSICKQASTSVDKYCKHLKDEITHIYKDGSQSYAINPPGKFFDISFVWRPADRTAYVLKKVANHSILSGALLAQLEGLVIPTISKNAEKKIALLKKLSDIEKKIEGSVNSMHTTDPEEVYIKEEAPKALSTPDLPEDVVSKVDMCGPDLASLANSGIVLSLPEFVRAFLGKEVANEPTLVPSVKQLLPGIFSRLLDRKLFSDLDLFDFSPDQQDNMLTRLLQNFIGDRSLQDLPSDRRALAVTIRKLPIRKLLLGPNSVGFSESSGLGSIVVKSSSEVNHLEKIAEAYGLYKVSVLANSNLGTNRKSQLLMVLDNYLI